MFDQRYVKRLDGPNVKKGKNKRDLAEQVMADIRKFKKDNDLDRLVMVWCGSTEIFMTESRGARSRWRASSAALEDERSGDSVEHGLRVRRDPRRAFPYANAAPNLTADIPALVELAAHTEVAAGRQGPEDRARR